MAAGTRQSNTMEEVLRKQLAMFADMKLADDADFDWIAKQEASIIERLRGPQDRANAIMAQQQTTAVTPQMGGPIGASPQTMPAPPPGAEMIMQALAAQGGAPGGGMPLPPGSAPGVMPPGRGPAMSPPMPPADELRRIMNQGQGIQQ